uniref:Uncharacterized protein n=1 Tax=Anguilla anguilla TaxID=7936 RepID=A0A0E9QN98_ANGAN
MSSSMSPLGCVTVTQLNLVCVTVDLRNVLKHQSPEKTSRLYML